MVGFAPSQVCLHLLEMTEMQPVDHAKSSGRIAFACKKVPPIYESVKNTGRPVVRPSSNYMNTIAS